jgi:hypothetical protein
LRRFLRVAETSSAIVMASASGQALWRLVHGECFIDDLRQVAELVPAIRLAA